jgi:K+-transporting ATPase ATPase A chain
MMSQSVIQGAVYFVIAFLLVKPVGHFVKRAYEGEPTLLGWLLRPLERVLCRLARVPALPTPLPEEAEMSWGGYLLSLLAFLGAGVVISRALEWLHVSSRAGRIVQSFSSAAIGIALLIALHRGLRRRHSASRTAGNPWMDLIRGSLYILLPLSLVLALLLASQALVQTAVLWIYGTLTRSA